MQQNIIDGKATVQERSDIARRFLFEVKDVSDFCVICQGYGNGPGPGGKDNPHRLDGRGPVSGSVSKNVQ